MSVSSEYAVVGCGVLGTSLCKQFLDKNEFEAASGESVKISFGILSKTVLLFLLVVGITKTPSRHKAILTEVGESNRFHVMTAEECKGMKFQNVVFCAPPSGFDNYAAAIEDSITNLWAGPSSGGVFVFTSSGGIYGSGAEGEVVNEGSPVADPSKYPRSARLIDAEKVVLENQGACLRLAGLYSLSRGAHNFWMTSGKDVSGRSDGIINLLHYDDAAGAVLAALSAGPSIVNGKVFLISDGHPMTRVEICQSALKNKKYEGFAMPKFVGSDHEPTGKIYDGSASNKALKWYPRFESFDAFLQSADASGSAEL
eukprot:scaffold24680_cov113-Cylindrotheca_fusiformis.AAC.1